MTAKVIKTVKANRNGMQIRILAGDFYSPHHDHRPFKVEIREPNQRANSRNFTGVLCETLERALAWAE